MQRLSARHSRPSRGPMLLVTGKQRHAISPLTGQMTLYSQTVHNYIYDHQTPPDLYSTMYQITDSLLIQGYDAYCDGISLVQGAITDTMQPSVWIATRSPLEPITVYAIILIVKYIIAAVIVVGIYFIVTALKELIYGVPKQYYIPDYPAGAVTWEEYISYQTAHYWYVCAKDGAGFGSKSLYPNIDDVPQSEVNAYRDHCALAPDIGPGDGLSNIVIIAVVGIVIVAALSFAGKLMR